eukprot:1531252-Rhodomonas_salina.1
MQQAFAFRSSVMSPEPKHQTEARLHPDAQEWIDAEWIKMDTIYCMGTIIFIPNSELPKGTSTIPTKFAYKCKFGDEGQEIKKK